MGEVAGGEGRVEMMEGLVLMERLLLGKMGGGERTGWWEETEGGRELVFVLCEGEGVATGRRVDLDT